MAEQNSANRGHIWIPGILGAAVAGASFYQVTMLTAKGLSYPLFDLMSIPSSWNPDDFLAVYPCHLPVVILGAWAGTSVAGWARRRYGAIGGGGLTSLAAALACTGLTPAVRRLIRWNQFDLLS